MDDDEYVDTEIASINFGIYSSEEIKSMAVCKITSSRLIDESKSKDDVKNQIILLDNESLNTKSKIGTVYDERMGPMDYKGKCETCKLTFKECPGHFGYIDLNIPILHPLCIKEIMNYLKCFCRNCYKLILSKEILELNDILKYKNYSRFKKILEKVEKTEICCHCKIKQYNLTCSSADGFIYINHKKKGESNISIPVPTETIQKIFNNIVPEEVELLGFDPKLIHPKNLILTVFPVMPPAARPPVMTDNHICDDDLTIQLTEIVKTNNNIIDENIPETKKQKSIQTLKFRIKTMMNNSQGKAKHTTNNRPINSIKDRLGGKKGLIRQNIMGKRVEFSARSVIGADPDIKTDEVSIPEEIAKNLTYPVRVTEYNINELTRIVNNFEAKRIKKIQDGKEKIINVNYALLKKGTKLLYNDVIYRGDKEITVKDLRNESVRPGDRIKRDGKFLEKVDYPIRKSIKLELGDIVERHIRNGDIVLINRQPTLWRGSMLAQKAVIKNTKTIRFNLSICQSMNADFDGKLTN